MNFAETLAYPIEGVAFSDAYLRFLEWAKSGGTSYKDWYSNSGAGYRTVDKIYTNKHKSKCVEKAAVNAVFFIEQSRFNVVSCIIV